jgi:sulfatase maturation enzyme AslB (radical SAM superfamily)
MALGSDPIASIKRLRTIAKKQDKFAFANLTGERMSDVVSDTFRIFTPHKPEKHRIDNGKDGQSFDMFANTVFDYPSIIQNKLGGSWEAYNSLLFGQVAYCNFHCWYCYVMDRRVAACSICKHENPLETRLPGQTNNLSFKDLSS